MSELTQLCVTDLVAKLQKKEVSSTELTQAYLNRAESKKGLNTFIHLDPQLALQQAADADKKLSSGERLPLLGVPIAVKDMILSKGEKATAGSKMLENFVAPYDSTVVSKLRAAGAVIFGRTNQDEFAMGSSNENSFFGPVKNPWDESRVPGGSSGGSSAALAAGLCAASLGTDTGGSIRQPASFCGVVGLKPTYGRVSRFGVIAFASSLDQVGPFTRTVSDSALITSVLCGRDPCDATSVDRPAPIFADTDSSLKGLRVGVAKEYSIGGVQKEVDESVQRALATLQELGATLVDISLPHTDAGISCYYILAPAEASSNLARYDGIRYGHRTTNAKGLQELYSLSRSEGFGAEVKRRIMIGSYVLSAGYFDAFYVRAQKVRALIKKDFDDAFAKHCDVIVSPTAPTTAFKLGEKTEDPLEMYLNDIFTIPVNLAGLPAMSIPCGFDDGALPIGLHLIAPHWEESRIFKVAKAFESATDWHKRTPA